MTPCRCPFCVLLTKLAIAVPFPTWPQANRLASEPWMMEYEGEWVQGIREGHGVRSYPNGEAYEGDFTAGVRHGHGRYSFTNKDVYAGEWVDDRRTGHGTYFYANGDVFVGEHHSVIDGPCRGKPLHKPRCIAFHSCSAGAVCQRVPPSGCKLADDCPCM